ncbi:MAG: hypothetical protein IJO88_06220 [Oscillospiraceae bacterium]|nr:hypothetical protein [Oscillospiraceae bacterium]
MEIWTKDAQGQAYEVPTWDALKNDAEGLDEKYFSKEDEGKALLTWFLEGFGLQGSSPRAEKVFAGKRETVKDLLDTFYDRGTDYWDEGLLNAIENDTEALVKGFETEDRDKAFCCIVMLCAVCAKRFADFPNRLQKAMRSRWKTDVDIGGKIPDILYFRQHDLSAGDMRVQVYCNHTDVAKTVELKETEDGIAIGTVKIPAGGQLTAWAIGGTATCIRGGLRSNGDWVAAAQGDKFVYCRVDGSNKKESAENNMSGVQDFAVQDKGYLCRVRGGEARVRDGDDYLTVQDVVGIYTMQGAYAAVHKNGTVTSNLLGLAKAEDICAAAKTEKDVILLLDRSGKVLASDEGTYSKEDVIRCMLAGFPEDDGDAAERIERSGHTYSITPAGRFSGA